MPEIYLSIIIPTYNEEKRLPKTLIDIENYLKRQNYTYEIIVVDGGSIDRTPEIVRGLSSVIKNLKLIEVKNCQGKGQAVKEAMLAAQGEFRLFTDADNSTTIDQIEKMWPEFKKGFDIVIGSRDIKGAVLAPPQPWLRKVILGGGFRLFRKLTLGLWQIQDTQCGFKGFSSKAAKDIFPRLRTLGFSFDAEVLLIAKNLGYKIKEMPVYWRNDPESKVKFKDIIIMAWDLIKIRLNHD